MIANKPAVMLDNPLISCLCVSNNRATFLKKSIANFSLQQYPNKELLIISFDLDGEYARIVAERNRHDIRLIKIPFDRSISLGDLRNISLEYASGEYFCIWDDDDWNHPDRLRLQMEAMESNRKAGSILAYCTLYNVVQKTAYTSPPLFYPATLICKKSLIYPKIKYPSMNKQEDSVFLERLADLNILYPLVNPLLYIYMFHGVNTSGGRHFNQLLKTSSPISKAGNELIKMALYETQTLEKAAALLESPELKSDIDYLGFFSNSKRDAHPLG